MLSFSVWLGYEQRDILYMARCYSSTLIFDKRFVKFIDTQSTCAFHYLHNGCNLVSKNPSPSTTPDIVANVDFGYVCMLMLTHLLVVVIWLLLVGVFVPSEGHP